MEIDNKYRPVPFWSWNGELDEKRLCDQIELMHSQGIGGFFMHARGGLTTEYLSDKWFSCIEACEKKAKELNMEAYAYDENGWPSGFAGGKLLEDESNRDAYLTRKEGPFDPNAAAAYDISGNTIKRVYSGDNVLNVYINISTSTADICNPEVVQKFIKLTHEEYKRHDIYGNLRGFFTDEPQYYRWGQPWTRVLPEYFKKKYNEDIFDRLGLIYVEKDGWRDFRYKYYRCLQEMMLDSYAKQIYEWCDANNYKLTGHYVEECSLGGQMTCCADIMPLYEYEHIPGCDWLGRQIGWADTCPKQVSSVCAQLGKPQVLTETFAMCGWDVTPLEYKQIADYLFVNGVTLMCHHLLGYSEIGQTKRDYPAHFNEMNPWIKKGFKEFNDHYSELGYLLSNSKEIVNVGVFHPIRSAYFDFDHDDPWSGKKMQKLEASYGDTLNAMARNHIPYHIIDEVLLHKHGHIEGSSLVLGLYKYDYLVIPTIHTMDKETEVVLREYIRNGGKVLLMGDKPEYLEGQPYSYEYLTSNVTLEDIINSVEYKTSYSEMIRTSYRQTEKGEKFLYVANLGEPSSITINGVTFDLDLYESKVIFMKDLKKVQEKVLPNIELGKVWTLTKPVDNYLLLDNLTYSLDGVSYSHTLNYMGALYLLIKNQVNQDVYFKYEFQVKDIPNNIRVLTEYQHIKELTINGVSLSEFTNSEELPEHYSYLISKYVKVGKNEIIIKIPFEVSEIEYRCWFDQTLLESIKNCLAYPVTSEPIYLVGDFGVYGDIKPGLRDNLRTGDNFYIGKQKQVVTSLIEDGFPFFRGDITLTQTVSVDDPNKQLFINDRFQIVDVYINDKYVDRLMLKRHLDLSKHLVKGDNKVTFVLTVSNRNLYGPNHLRSQEDFGVGPFSWELTQAWKEDGTSDLMTKEYAFVKTII